MKTPSTFFIELTNKCNMKCKHCFAVSNSLIMNKTILDKSIEYICNKINESNNDEYTINFLGGEAGLYKQDYIIESINKIKESLPKRTLRFIYQSNLTYELTDKHIEAFKLVDDVNTSYDYGIRFATENQFNLWKNNIKKLQKNDIYTSLTMVLTKPFIEHFTPESLIKFLETIDIKDIEFNCLFKTIDGNDLSEIRAKNIDVNNWLYDLYMYIKSQKIDIKIKTFKCIEDSFIGNYYNDHCRTCCEENITIIPNGNVITCMLDYNYPIYNVVTNKELYSLKKVLENESNLPEKCLECKYLKWCKGNCHHYQHDETDCPTPKKIYDYLIMKKDLEENVLI